MRKFEGCAVYYAVISDEQALKYWWMGWGFDTVYLFNLQQWGYAQQTLSNYSIIQSAITINGHF